MGSCAAAEQDFGTVRRATRRLKYRLRVRDGRGNWCEPGNLTCRSSYWIAVELAVCSPNLPWMGADPRAVPIYRSPQVILVYCRAAARSALCHKDRAGRDQFLDPPTCEPALA